MWTAVWLAALGLQPYGFVNREHAIQIATRWRPSIHILSHTDDTGIYADPRAVRRFAAAVVHLHAHPNAMGCVVFAPDMTLFVVDATSSAHTVHAVLWGPTTRGREKEAADELRAYYEALTPPLSLSFAPHANVDG